MDRRTPLSTKSPRRGRHGFAAALIVVLSFTGSPVFAQSQKPKAAKETPISLAISDLKATYNIKKELAEGLSDVVVAEASRLKGYKIITQREIDAMLSHEQKKQMAGCTDTSCVVALGGALGVDKMLLGSISLFEKTFVVGMNLVDVRNAAVDERVSIKFEGSDKQLLEEVEKGVRQLLGVRAALPPVSTAAAVKAQAVQRTEPPAAKKEVPVAAAPSGSPTYKVLYATSFAIAATSGVSAILVGKWANDAGNEAQSKLHDRDTATMLQNDYESRAMITNTLMGVAAGGFAVGALFLTLDLLDVPKQDERKAGGAQIAPVVGLGSVGVTGIW